MLENMPDDLKTRALVLRRTNYGEADRILNLITPVGKIAVMAKGIRKPKAKLAGAVEIFTLLEANLHFGKKRGGEGLATLTGAKMVRFYGGILKDFNRMELATDLLKRINRAAESVDTPEHFEILNECLIALDEGADLNLVEAWFLIRLTRAMGEQINLMTDVNGEKLKLDQKYEWDFNEMAFFESASGNDTNLIKILRLMWATDLKTVRRIKNLDEYLPLVLKIAQAVSKVVK